MNSNVMYQIALSKSVCLAGSIIKAFIQEKMDKKEGRSRGRGEISCDPYIVLAIPRSGEWGLMRDEDFNTILRPALSHLACWDMSPLEVHVGLMCYTKDRKDNGWYDCEDLGPEDWHDLIRKYTTTTHSSLGVMTGFLAADLLWDFFGNP